MRLLFVLLLVAFSSAACASPCNGIDQELTAERSTVLAPEIAKQLAVPKVSILQSFQTSFWSVIYVDTHQTDEVFLFYSGSPLESRYVTLWSGSASAKQQREIRNWVHENVPGIPKPLASCFAWYVTQGRGS